MQPVDGRWLKLYLKLEQNPVWRHRVDFRLFIWLLLKAKANQPQGEVRFTYIKAQEGTAYDDETFSVQRLRRSLQRMARGDSPVITKRQRAEGITDRGYFIISICQWERYQGLWGAADTPGDSQVIPKRQPGDTPRREGEGEGEGISSSESPSEPPQTRPAGAGLLLKKLWNEGAKRAGLPEVTRMGEWRSKRATLLLTACGAPEALEGTVRAFQAWPFAKDRRLSIDTLLRARGREKYVEWGQTFLAGATPHALVEAPKPKEWHPQIVPSIMAAFDRRGINAADRLKITQEKRISSDDLLDLLRSSNGDPRAVLVEAGLL